MTGKGLGKIFYSAAFSLGVFFVPIDTVSGLQAVSYNKCPTRTPSPWEVL